MPPPENGTIWLSPEQVADRLPISRKTVYKALRSGELIGEKVCSRWMVPEDNIEPWITGATEPSPRAVQARTPQPPARGSLAALRAIERESA